MRVKEIDRTANMAWSPEDKYPIYIATGTAAQQLDATFSTTSAIELYGLNIDEATLDMPVVASVESDARFHKIVWGPLKDTESGVIIGGSENGSIHVYSADKLLSGSKDCLSAQLSRHIGSVKALDLNPFQQNLLASGAGDSEIYIWDLLKSDSPMTPGQKSQPPEELASVAWNCQVQHILGSTFATRCVVWDLRKNEPIIKISDSMSRIKAKLIAWHPEVATQLCLSSEDDHTPVIQVWDLRYATSPLKVLESHTKGVLSMSWCKRDPDLLLSSGKDNRILCWNPNSNVQNGEVVYDLSTNNQWCFDIQWCIRNPSIISSASFDGHITLYSILGGGHPVQPSNKVAESFGGAQFGSAPVQVPHEEDKTLPLQKPPKWIRKPVGASFAFGGKLVSFVLDKPTHPQQPVSRTVTISQVVTETELVVRSNQLEQALNDGRFSEFCAMKVANSKDSMQENIWNFMKVNFEKEPRTKYLELLGYDQNELARKVIEHTGTEVSASSKRGVDAQELAQKMSLLNTGSIMKADRLLASGQASPNVGSKTPVDQSDDLNGSAIFDEISASQQKSGNETPLVIPTNNADGLMTQALLTGNFEAAVEMCLSEDRMAEAILLAIAGGPELLVRTQKKYFQRNKSTLGRLISSVITHDWAHIVETCDLDNWKEALAVILTYALPEEFAPLCDTLARRLEKERNGDLSLYASLCYICSGNVEKLVENWIQNTEDPNQPLALQDLVEKIMILRKAVELSRGTSPSVSGGAIAEKLSQYAGLLAAQGNLAPALTYLNNTSDTNLAILQDRLIRALGQNPASLGVKCPFPQLNVLSGVENVNKTAVGTAAYQRQDISTSSAKGFTQTQYYNPTNTQNYTPPANPVPKTTPVHKGAKYPQYPSSTPAYPNYMQSDYNQQQTYSNLYSPNTFSPATNQPSNFFTPVSSSGPSPSVYNPAGPSAYNPAGPSPSVYNPTGPAQPLYNPAAPSPSVYNPVGPSPSVYNPSASSTSVYNTPIPAPQQQSIYSYQDKPAESAWNDPPIVLDKKSSHASPSDHPPGAPTYPGLYNPMEHHPAPQLHSNTPYGVYNPATPAHTVPQSSPQVPAPAVEPVPHVQRGPIPKEHQVLQDVFDKLVKNCSQVAPNAQMKRKLEDVTRKLELLYDKLRENLLSQTALVGLHQIVQAIQQYDYNSSLAVYTGMVSHGNFSEISNFMPAIKVLLQSALQLQVYVQ
ncbi:protein transport protein Sec31A isoform X1 [Biomphalaria glabrata]|uniref:Protein transport protein Sec31A n=1 Tax=Biomphalaria glabrata TaxID=6526 RepID=A0A2C9JFS3_BIOGL|nr:protein transport protein Sec31A isoform X1 [Biomphalaria glabrata]